MNEAQAGATANDAVDPTARAGTAIFAATVDPAVMVLRWASVGYGLVAIAPERAGADWGDVGLLALCVFLTTLRTIMPLRLGADTGYDRALPVVDVAVFSVAVGLSGATESPWLLCLLTALGLAAYGWGRGHALVSGIVAVAMVTLLSELSGDDLSKRLDDAGDLLAVVSLALSAAGGLFLRARAIEAMRLARETGGEVARLRSANILLQELTGVALTLPGAFTLREALVRTRDLLSTYMDPRTIVLVTLDENTDEWTPKITDRAAMRATYRREDLPEPLCLALEVDTTVQWPRATTDHTFLDPDSASGIYLVLHARGQAIGVLALEHPDPGHFDAVDPVLREGLGDVIALTVDNARWFARLRSLGAQEERVRVARDVHDRLGQWMTYIKMELERLSSADEIPPEDLRQLHDDAAYALDELRETLRQLRSGVTDDRPLGVMGRDLVERFADRSDVAARFVVTNPDQHLPVPVENEILRILQEALNNIDRHAKAQHAEVAWTVDGGNYELTVTDDGCGFDPANAVREQSYGLVGMRERAEVIGATLEVASTPGDGTRLSVSAGKPVARAALDPAPPPMARQPEQS
ncbi:MAG: sensor histidine kinase [Microthrixaceae bacterium]